VDGTRVTPRSLPGILAARKPGDGIEVLYARRGAVGETAVVLGRKSEPSYRITLLENPTPAQKALLDAWLKRP
jgi:predicted metalloprotease with PDZ domain